MWATEVICSLAICPYTAVARRTAQDAATAKRLLCSVLFFVFVMDFALIDPITPPPIAKLFLA